MTVSSSQLELCPPLDEPKLLRLHVYIFPEQRRYHVIIFYFWYFKGLLLGILRSALFFFSSLLSLLRILSLPFLSLRCFWRKIRWITNRRFCRPKILSRNKFLFKSWTRSRYWMLAVKISKHRKASRESGSSGCYECCFGNSCDCFGVAKTPLIFNYSILIYVSALFNKSLEWWTLRHMQNFSNRRWEYGKTD